MDEADRLLEQGCTDFTVDLEAILAAVPARRQTLLFSATLTDTLRELQGLAANQPFFWEAQAPCVYSHVPGGAGVWGQGVSCGQGGALAPFSSRGN